MFFREHKYIELVLDAFSSCASVSGPRPAGPALFMPTDTELLPVTPEGLCG